MAVLSPAPNDLVMKLPPLLAEIGPNEAVLAPAPKDKWGGAPPLLFMCQGDPGHIFLLESFLHKKSSFVKTETFLREI